MELTAPPSEFEESARDESCSPNFVSACIAQRDAVFSTGFDACQFCVEKRNDLIYLQDTEVVVCVTRENRECGGSLTDSNLTMGEEGRGWE